jgi:hypothetical protein
MIVIPPSYTLHILAERTSGTRQWTYRTRHNSISPNVNRLLAMDSGKVFFVHVFVDHCVSMKENVCLKKLLPIDEDQDDEDQGEDNDEDEDENNEQSVLVNTHDEQDLDDEDEEAMDDDQIFDEEGFAAF